MTSEPGTICDKRAFVGAALLWAALALLAPRAHARQDPFELRTAVDGPWLTAALVLWVTPSLVGDSLVGPRCDPCDPRQLNALDRPAIDNHSSAADTAGDVLSAALPATAALAGLLHYRSYGWRAVGTDALLILQSMATAGVLNQIVRHAVRRPRPFMYVAGARDADTRGHGEAALSFYSGHTATVFAAATAFSYAYFVRRPQSWTRWLVLAGALAAASAMPVLRVASGEHFPSDVLVGAAAGSAFGLLVPALHRRGPITVTPAPTAGGGAGLGVAGRF